MHFFPIRNDMKIFLIAGEASGDLHAAHLMRAIKRECPTVEFRYYGGDKMQAEGGTLLCHYRHLAYMGFVQVALHLPTILRGMRNCKRAIEEWRPDAVVLVDYPGFNLKMARYVKRRNICPVFYYISPKIWAWKEHRIRQIRRDVDRLFSILPFEVDFFERKHHYPISYVGNPTMDEVTDYIARHGAPADDGRTIALLPGSRRQEIKDNLSRMLQAAEPFTDYKLVIATVPNLLLDDVMFYVKIIISSGIDMQRVMLAEESTYSLLSHAHAALVTSGTATLETALFRVPQVVCYYMRMGWFISLLRPFFLKVPYISLVNLIAEREAVPELVASQMNVKKLRRQLERILPLKSVDRKEQLEGYDLVARRLGSAGAPERAAREMLRILSNK